MRLFTLWNNYFYPMILVTGGTGFVGAHLLYQLSLKDKPVVAIHRAKSDFNALKNIFRYYSKDYQKYFDKIIWKLADLNDIPELEKAFSGIETVYHCAALVSFDPKDYNLMRHVNIEGTQKIVNLSIINSVKKLCFVSSIATLEKNIKKEWIDETCIWTTNNHKSGYAITKRGAEMEVWRGSQENVDCIVVNPGVVIGSGFWKSGTGNLFGKVYNGLKYYTPGSTGFVGVEDVATAMIALMDSEVKNEGFILVSENWSFKKLLTQIAKGFQKPIPSKKLSKNNLEWLWKLARVKSAITGKKPELTRSSAQAAYGNKKFSSEKLLNTIGFEFELLEKTVQKTCNNFISDLKN